MEEANERKRAKYTDLEECRRQGWRAPCVPIKVGCRGFAAQSLCKAYSLLGITGARQRKAIKTTTEAAEKASRWLWIKRGDPWVHRPKVAFYTALTNSGHVGPYNTAITLKFSKVFTNIGNAYNPATGFFTAPVKGVYYFQFTVFGFQAGSMGITVYKNSKRIMDNWGSVPNGGSEYITNSLVLELIAGDEIHLVLPSGYSLFDNETNYSTFSGALLFPL
uniref:C1q domain-containing protein n=1 Tax=Dicentrarchus labrax TaxID=13489 RepID=A0A8P4PXN3_DICLA